MVKLIIGNKGSGKTKRLIELVNGAVEKSNVDPISEMTKMIKLQRSYEMVQSMIDEEHDRLSNTISTYSQLA